MKLHLLTLCILFIFAQTVIGQGWKNIVPLKSTKTDVEKILGNPTEKSSYGENGFNYSVSDGTITVFYAPENCSGEIRGWNVAPNTVLTFTLFPNQKLTTDYGKIYESNFVTFATDTLNRYFIDSEKGLIYFFKIDRKLVRIEFTPKATDNSLRCEGFPPYDAAGATYFTDLTYKLADIETIKDEVGAHLPTMPKNTKMYIVAYSGDSLSKTKFNNYLQAIRKYIRLKGKANQSKVIIIDGGKRKSSEVEIYFLPEDYPPPMPKPNY